MFDTVKVPQSDRKYQPTTLAYGDVLGTSQRVQSSKLDNEDGLDPFAKDMLALDGDHDGMSDVIDIEGGMEKALIQTHHCRCSGTYNPLYPALEFFPFTDARNFGPFYFEDCLEGHIVLKCRVICEGSAQL